jgi:hypothetical protein
VLATNASAAADLSKDENFIIPPLEFLYFFLLLRREDPERSDATPDYLTDQHFWYRYHGFIFKKI